MKCKNFVEMLYHPFLECHEVEQLKSSSISEWDFIFHNISDDDKLFGIIDEKSKNWELKNHLLLIAKSIFTLLDVKVLLCRSVFSTYY